MGTLFEDVMHVQSLKRFLIRSRWRRWLAPAFMLVPYIASIIWLMTYSQLWIAMVMLVPVSIIADRFTHLDFGSH